MQADSAVLGFITGTARDSAALNAGYLARKEPDVLKEERRRSGKLSLVDDANFARFTYSMGLTGIEPRTKKTFDEPSKRAITRREVREVSRAWLAKMTELGLKAVSGRISDEETGEQVAVASEYVLKYLKSVGAWKTPVLQLNEGNTGLRTAPKLVKMLVVYPDSEAAVKDYNKELRKVEEATPFVFRGNVIDEFSENKVKKGPEYYVPLLEEEMDWDTGKVTGGYIHYMLRYRHDISLVSTSSNRILKNGAKILSEFVLRPKPEYEPISFRYVVDENGKIRVTHAITRDHWIVVTLPIEMVDKTEAGEYKVTAVSDESWMTNGHMPVFVTKNPLVAYATARKLNKELDTIEHVLQEAFLLGALMKAHVYYDEGETYKMAKKSMMEESDQRSDPFAKRVR